MDVTEYKNIHEFETLFNTGKFELFQINNDFINMDLLQSLIVTFQSSRPLIVFDTAKHTCYQLLEEAKRTIDVTKRYEIYKKIEREILIGGYIAPISYSHILFLHDTNLEITKWSKLFPEIAFWKATAK